MSLLTRLNRPEYLFRPRAILRRLRRGRGDSWDGSSTREVPLPWRQRITVFGDEIGRTIIASGIFDVSVTETIHRLTGRGDVAVDVGANVGYLTSLMAARAGPEGDVAAFEPHPSVFEVLAQNARRWDAEPGLATVEARRLALSDRAGTGRLRSEGDPDSHLGLSSLEGTDDGEAYGFEVELATLDQVLGDREVQLLKLDVEGHEHAVLQGARALLEAGRIRDVVFEEHAIYPAPSMTFLEERGMTLFALSHSLLGPRVRPISEGPAPPLWPGPNYLATRDPDRALSLLRPRGWQALGGVARLARAR